jgi:NAD(P)H-flavin reductase
MVDYLRLAKGLSLLGTTSCIGWWSYQKYCMKQPAKELSLYYQNCKVSKVTPVSDDTILMNIATYGDFKPCSSVLINDSSCQIVRAYTPISFDQHGFDILVKRYPNGTVSRMIHNTPVGSTLSIRGPIRTLEYKQNAYPQIGMVAGGTGITPMYQLIRHILSDPSDKTIISLVYANNRLQDILLKKELDMLEKSHPDRFKISYTLLDAPKDWKGGVGYVSNAMLEQNLPDPKQSAILCCGPEG